MAVPKNRDQQKINLTARLRSAERVSQGLCARCSDGTKAIEGKTLCPTHLEQLRQKALRRRLRQIDQGLCTSCGKEPSIEGLRSCAKCLIRTSKEARDKGARGKRRVVEYLGHKCQRCGLVTEHMSVYEIHHLSKRNKEFNIKTMHSWSWARIKAELDKGVQLLCANCHRIIQHSHPESWANK